MMYWFLNASHSPYEQSNGWVEGGMVSNLVGVEDKGEIINPCGVHSMGVQVLRTSNCLSCDREYPGGEGCCKGLPAVYIFVCVSEGHTVITYWSAPNVWSNVSS